MGYGYERKKTNKEIREAKGKIPWWVIALHLEIHETTLVRHLRVELNGKEKQKILNVINHIKNEGMKV